jgi:hypothetical protein
MMKNPCGEIEIAMVRTEFFSFPINDGDKLRNIAELFIKDVTTYGEGYERYKVRDNGLIGIGEKIFRFISAHDSNGEVIIA